MRWQELLAPGRGIQLHVRRVGTPWRNGLVIALVWSQLSSRARGLTPPPVLPDPGPLRAPRN